MVHMRAQTPFSGLAQSWFAALAMLASAGVARAQERSTGGMVHGKVSSSPAQVALAGAVVEILGTIYRATSDSAGSFRLERLPLGSRTIRIRAIGHEPASAVVNLRPDTNVRLDISLNALAELPELSVEAARLRVGDERLIGFHERRLSGFGKFVTREDIVKRDVTDSRELLRGIPGVRIAGRHIQMSSGQASSRNCVVQYYLDGVHMVMPSADLLAQLRPSDIEGIEVYRGPAETPPIFSRGGAECGVIAIWTRTPGGNR
jgi:hypothetical protein